MLNWKFIILRYNKIEIIIYGEEDLIERIFEKLDDADQDYYNEIFDDLGI